jgi:hypothetical protein
MVAVRLRPGVERMDSCWALKVRVRWVGYVDLRLGSEWSFMLAFQVGGDLGVGSSEASMASRKETTNG